MTRILAAVFFGFALTALPLHAESEFMMRPVPAGLTTQKPNVIAMAPIPDSDAVDNGESDAELAIGGHKSSRACLATAIYFEARGESLKGQRAVGEVILARTHQRGRPKSVCGVVYEGSQRSTGCQFSFTCDRIADVVRNGAAWARAQRAAGIVMSSRGRKRVSRGATHYHAASIRPYWASHMVKVARIGSHIFYR